MINGLQLFVHLPLFEVSLPASAQILIDKLLTIATFDLIESETAFGAIIEFPEEDENELSGKFVETGYESAYMINLLGIGFIIFVNVLVIMFILLITYPCSKYLPKVKKVHNKVTGIIFWGFWIRFLMEESLVAFISVLCDLFHSNEC